MSIVSLQGDNLDRRANKIRSLMQAMARNTIIIGKELLDARATFPIGPNQRRMGWSTWLKKEFSFSEVWATKLIRIHEKFGHLDTGDRQLPSLKVLDFLTVSHIPPKATKEILRRTGKGETIGIDAAKQIADKFRPPPKKANEIAKKTGKPTIASDGYLYLGGSEDDVREANRRRTIVYTVKRAITDIANVKLSPEEFLEYALPHQLWKPNEVPQIEQALEWIGALYKAMRKNDRAS